MLKAARQYFQKYLFSSVIHERGVRRVNTIRWGDKKTPVALRVMMMMALCTLLPMLKATISVRQFSLNRLYNSLTYKPRK